MVAVQMFLESLQYDRLFRSCPIFGSSVLLLPEGADFHGDANGLYDGFIF